MQIQMVTFSAAKDGNAPGEWQDGACGGVAADGSWARFLVLDGATTAYDPVRWVDQLVRSFAPPAGGSGGPGGSRLPRLEPAAMRAWFGEMQDQWAAEVRDFDSIIEERKFAEVGSFATLLGFDIYGLDGPEPRWRGVALGDTVLFHVRAGRLIASFPPSVSASVVRESAEGQRAALARLLASRDRPDNPMRSVPVVVLSRGQDPTPGLADDHAALARVSANSRHAVIATAGHEIHLYSPAVVIQAIQDVSTAAKERTALPARP